MHRTRGLWKGQEIRGVELVISRALDVAENLEPDELVCHPSRRLVCSGGLEAETSVAKLPQTLDQRHGLLDSRVTLEVQKASVDAMSLLRRDLVFRTCVVNETGDGKSLCHGEESRAVEAVCGCGPWSATIHEI